MRDVSGETLAGYRRGLDEILAARPSTLLVETVDGDVEATYDALRRALGG